MPKTPEILAELTDVIALSKKICSRPIQANLAYATNENFIGRVINGYTPNLINLALLTKEAANALCEVQNDLIANHDLGLLIYDSYRPKRAVLDFVAWSTKPPANPHEIARKQIHYPHIEKHQMFDLGYVAEDSQHCYGHTVDLVLIDKTGKEINLGACFDFMDSLSHLTATAEDIGQEAFHNRSILTNIMKKYGFIPYVTEFWHFSFKNRAFNQPIDIEITEELQGL